MAVMEAVLPRVRAKRKRLKPPPPSFWWALGWVVWDVLFLGFDVFLAARQGGFTAAWSMGCGAIMAASLYWRTWPRFRRELDAWLKDQD